MGYTPHILVIGGGVLGTGIARDLAIRGLDVTLVERGTLATGATGRMQGILYSAARFADSPDMAKLVHSENETLREIAGHCIEDTGGLLVSHAGDSDERFESLLEGCAELDFPVEELDVEAVREREPELGEDVERALAVPDAVVDPFRLTVANAKGALEHGAEIRSHTEIIDVAVEDGTIGTVTVRRDPSPTGKPEVDDERGEPATDGGRPGETGTRDDQRGDTDGKEVPGSGRRGAHAPGGLDTSPSLPDDVAERFERMKDDSVEEIDADYVVNAAGPWAGEVAGLAGFDLPLSFSQGAMVVVDDCPVDAVVTRWREDDEGNTVVPYGTNALLGTTHRDVAGPHDVTEEGAEVDLLVDGLSEVVPAVWDPHALRSYWGVRSWPEGADSEHGFAIYDHGEYDDCWGMSSVLGGSLTTHRAVAEAVAGDVCRKFGISRTCRTAEIPLPGSEDEQILDDAMAEFDVDSPLVRRTRRQPGQRGSETFEAGPDNPVVCECQAVTRAEIQDAMRDESGTALDLNDVRIRTSASMGECQGGLCAHRLAAELYPTCDSETTEATLDGLLAERWKGQRHTLWGEGLQIAMQNYALHAGTMNRKSESTVLLSSREADVSEESDDQENEESGMSGKTGGVSPSANSVPLGLFDDGGDRERSERPMWGERQR